MERSRELYLCLDRQPPNATLKGNDATMHATPTDFPCGKSKLLLREGSSGSCEGGERLESWKERSGEADYITSLAST